MPKKKLFEFEWDQDLYDSLDDDEKESYEYNYSMQEKDFYQERHNESQRKSYQKKKAAKELGYNHL